MISHKGEKKCSPRGVKVMLPWGEKSCARPVWKIEGLSQSGKSSSPAREICGTQLEGGRVMFYQGRRKKVEPSRVVDKRCSPGREKTIFTTKKWIKPSSSAR